MQTIPITFSSTPTPVGVQVATLDQLLALMARYFQGQITTTVSFFDSGASDPTQLVTPLFFNTAQGTWKYWDTGAGKYLAVTPFTPGDTKYSFVAGDEIQQGWIVLDGRQISSIQGISQDQASVLYQLFGVNGSLPTVTAAQNLSDLPAANAYSSIVTDGPFTPPSGQIGALPFGATYDASQSQALAQNTETLRGSAVGVQNALTSVNDVNKQLLAALRGSAGSSQLYAKVFVSFP